MLKKKVLLVIRWPVGGIRTFVRYVYRNFDTDRWQFTILAPAAAEIEAMKNDLAGLGVRFVLTSERPSAAAFALAVTREMWQSRYHLVHSHGFTSGICTTLPAKLLKVPHLMTSHDVINPVQFSGSKGWLKKQAMGWMFNLIDCIHSVSNDAQENLLSYFPNLDRGDGRCVVIPNGIEVERFLQAEPRDLRRELGLGREFFLVGFFGRFMSQKGFRYLVEAMELLVKQDLARKPIVVAFGWGGFIREEQQAIKERGLQEYFRFMPFTDNVAGAIKGVDVVVIPSLWEACPLLPMEVLTSGVSLIATDCIGLREVIEGTPTKRISAQDSKAIAEAICYMENHDTLDIFKTYKSRASVVYDVKTQRVRMSNLYAQLIT